MSWKKIFILLGLFSLLIFLPIFICLTSTLLYFQSMVDDSPQASMAKWTQMAIADVFYYTRRPERSVDAYWKFINLYPEDPRVPAATYYYAASLDDMGKRDKAMEAYTYFIEKYPDNDKTDDAREAHTRLKLNK